MLKHRTWKLADSLQRCIVSTLLILAGSHADGQSIVSQYPLSAGGNVPGNLLLTPSVEWPTINSVANLGNYSATNVYVGYFDSSKCYQYFYSSTESERHFYPASTTADRTCSGAWSGNFLNWAVTQTIDPFRKALTGGNRVRDTVTETWLEKARHDGQGGTGIYPNRRLPDSGNSLSTVSGATPFNVQWMRMRIQGLGNKMRFRLGNDGVDTGVIAFNPASSSCTSNGCEVSVRVKVCASGLLESNCKQYMGGWKPEGLIQKYSDRIRYSVFGYLNDSTVTRDGGVLRAKQKFVGAQKIDPSNGNAVTNLNQEWDPETGVLIQNPDATDATATTGAIIVDSGVINYINKFGQMTTQNHKSYDPVSELYYAAIRYLKNQGNVAEYSSMSGTAAQQYNLADGFPVITQWGDPIQLWCQNNAILGIGDVYTHRDKNLPGNTVTTDEPAQPTAVGADATVNVVTATQKVAQLEGITINTPFTGRENSAYIAGLAYDSHTKDMRSDLEEKQTVSTYWVDVRENQTLEARARNQYWLAAKYGGFTVPDDFDPYTQTAALDPSLWSSGETLSTGDPRPENFYVASEAGKMVESLTRAFAKIAAESVGSASSLAANSTRLDTDTKVYQAQFFSGTWRGDLKAYSVTSNGSLSSSPTWRAGTLLASATWSSRQIYVHNPQGSGASKHALFTWSNLGSTQQTALGSQNVVDYLRGDRSKEESQANGTLRTRTGILGDIVNSTPIFVGAPNSRLYAGSTFSGASSYSAFVTAQASRTPVIFVGANDGMLHMFNANTGVELYAFVPNTVILNGLKQYSDPTYTHKYFVDGEIAVADIYDTSGSGTWKTVLVGTLGRGGPGVFALDVTDPSSIKFLWEKNSTDIAALGKNIGRPVIAQVADGDWRVLIGNGPDSSGGSAQLIAIQLDSSGSVTTVNTGASGSNGLSAVLARDSNGDGFADTAYAGDLLGNLWKFTGLSGSPSSTKLFVAQDPSNNIQPITAAPMVGKDPATGQVWVFFGTGKYLQESDLSDTQIQTWYGLKDSGALITGRSQLVERSILDEDVIGNFAVRVIEEGDTAELLSKQGWYIDLVSPDNGAEGERMVVPNRFQGAALIGTTRIPETGDLCRPGGRGYVMAINPFTGARLTTTFFDINGDGVFNEQDMLNGTIVSGIGFDDSPNNPIFIENVMQVSLDDGTTETIKTQGSAAQAQRTGWRELFN